MRSSASSAVFDVRCPLASNVVIYPLLAGDEMGVRARRLIEKAGSQPDARAILDLVSTILVYRFTALTRDEVMEMLGIESATLQQTRFYQDIKAECEANGLEREKALVLKLLKRKLKKVPIKLQNKVNDLDIDRIESLGEALLDFNTVADLEKFLDG
jgi:predicted transposase YdaD